MIAAMKSALSASLGYRPYRPYRMLFLYTTDSQASGLADLFTLGGKPCSRPYPFLLSSLAELAFPQPGEKMGWIG
ncbi:hypothetical protein KTAU_35750 [Thermogemmatispora aurantia]|uniref:Uncharacterized protein n=1 Tax=Thermogemmatispora aurantia TaxID=2045279 RepID=A0A5J4KEL1_9CHLR|nr:hypothetical protein KTAU_35750 [Thermogemmatispora aurantia]